MRARAAVICLLWMAPLMAADWNPRLAAQYLDSRQKDWFAWPTANANAKPCVSCHTGMTYLLARPALRRALGEKEPTVYETGLLASLRSRVDKREPPAGPGLGVETVLAALFLTEPEPFSALRPALDRMWALQIKDGEGKGAWNWFSLKLDPWEMPESRFYGAALAGSAVPEFEKSYFGFQLLKAYLKNEQASQPLHNRLMFLWAFWRVPDVLDAEVRREITAKVWQAQQSDGSWTTASMGPFVAQPGAPEPSGGNAYMTAFTAFVMQQQSPGVRDSRIEKALNWLRAHQNPVTGRWPAVSMNKKYPAGSQESKFMTDAATAFAALALLAADSH